MVTTDYADSTDVIPAPLVYTERSESVILTKAGIQVIIDYSSLI